MCSQMFIAFIAALFIIAKTENEQCPSAGKCITNTMEALLSNKNKRSLYSCSNKNEFHNHYVEPT